VVCKTYSDSLEVAAELEEEPQAEVAEAEHREAILGEEVPKAEVEAIEVVTKTSRTTGIILIKASKYNNNQTYLVNW
jgi:hypothetical protein